MEPIVVDFEILRTRQAMLISESDWMACELRKLQAEGEGTDESAAEALMLVNALQSTAREFLDGQIGSLKYVALRQREPGAANHFSPELPVQQIEDRLHAAVAPLHGLIERLQARGDSSLLGMLLMAGMAPCLHAVGDIHEELEHVRRQWTEEEEGRDDYGVYDPGSG